MVRFISLVVSYFGAGLGLILSFHCVHIWPMFCTNFWWTT